jgi:hypothetical protein
VDVTGRGGPGEQVRWAVRLSRDVIQDEGLGEYARRGAGIVQRRWAKALQPRAVPTAPTRAAQRLYRVRAALDDQFAAARPARARAEVLIVHDPDSPVARPDRVRLWRDLAELSGRRWAVHRLRDAPQSGAEVVVLLDLPWTRRAARLARTPGATIVVEATGPWEDTIVVRHDPNLAAGPWTVRDALVRESAGRRRLRREADVLVVPTAELGALLPSSTPPVVVPDAVDSDLALWSRGVVADPVVRRFRSEPQPPTLGLLATAPGWRADFAAAEAVLVEVLRARPTACVRLLGTGEVPGALAAFGDRATALPPLSPGNQVREAALCHVLVGRTAATPAASTRGAWVELLAEAAGVPLLGGPGVDSHTYAARLLALLDGPSPVERPVAQADVALRALPAAAPLLAHAGRLG